MISMSIVQISPLLRRRKEVNVTSVYIHLFSALTTVLFLDVQIDFADYSRIPRIFSFSFFFFFALVIITHVSEQPSASISLYW